MSQTGGPGGGALLRSQETGWAGLGDGGMATPSCSGIRSATQALSNHRADLSSRNHLRSSEPGSVVGGVVSESGPPKSRVGPVSRADLSSKCLGPPVLWGALQMFPFLLQSERKTPII